MLEQPRLRARRRQEKLLTEASHAINVLMTKRLYKAPPNAQNQNQIELAERMGASSSLLLSATHRVSSLGNAHESTTMVACAHTQQQKRQYSQCKAKLAEEHLSKTQGINPFPDKHSSQRRSACCLML